MTYPTAPTFPGLTESVLDPILIGITTPSHDLQVLYEVWRTAADSIPTTIPFSTCRSGRPLKRKGTVAAYSPDREPTTSRSHSCAISGITSPRTNPGSAGGGRSAPRSPRRRWATACRVQPYPIRVDVTSYRLEGGKVLDAQQLALFRHYVVVGFQAIDPRAVVVGGQHDWQDNWWPIAQP